MIFNSINQIIEYAFIGIIVLCFFIGSVLILDDFRLNIYRLSTDYKKFKNKISYRFLKSNKNSFIYIKPLFREKINNLFSSLFCRRPYRMTFYSLVFIVLLLYNQNKDMFSQKFLNYFSIILVFTVIDFLTRYSIQVVTKGFSNNFFLDALFVIFYIGALALLCFSSMLISIGEGQSLNFAVVLILLFMILIPLSRFATVCINMQKKSFNIIIVLLIFLVFESTIYMLFGSYNISIDNAIMKNINTDQVWLGTLQIIQAGTEYIFYYPTQPARIEYTIQYLIGFFVHVIIIGFYISIVSSKIIQINGSKEDNIA